LKRLVLVCKTLRGETGRQNLWGQQRQCRDKMKPEVLVMKGESTLRGNVKKNLARLTSKGNSEGTLCGISKRIISRVLIVGGGKITFSTNSGKADYGTRCPTEVPWIPQSTPEQKTSLKKRFSARTSGVQGLPARKSKPR